MKARKDPYIRKGEGGTFKQNKGSSSSRSKYGNLTLYLNVSEGQMPHNFLSRCSLEMCGIVATYHALDPSKLVNNILSPCSNDFRRRDPTDVINRIYCTDM